MLIRTQIQFTEEQHRRLKSLARRRGVSVSEIVRRSVDRALAAASDEPGALDARYERALAVAGRFHDQEAASDVSIEHDRYLDEAFADRVR